MTRSIPVGALALAVTVALGAACAHTKITQRDGCWVRSSETRWGDTSETLAVCEPRPPVYSEDPMSRAVEVCLYQAQMAWYNEAVQRLRQDKEPPALPSWHRATKVCLDKAMRDADERITELEAQLAGMRDRVSHLREENESLRSTLVSCVEKTPNAYAEASATTNSTSDSGTTNEATHEAVFETVSAGEGRETPRRRVVRRMARAPAAPVAAPTDPPAAKPARGRGACPAADGAPPKDRAGVSPAPTASPPPSPAVAPVPP